MLCRHVSYSCFYAVYVIFALNGSFVLYCFKRSKAFKLRNRIRNVRFLPGTAIHLNLQIIVVTFPRQSSTRLEGECCFVWGMQLICWMFSLVTHCHIHYHLHQFYFMLYKFKDLVAKQHPTSMQTVNYEFKVMPKVS